MKKILIILSFGLLMTSSLMADFMRVESGVGVWLNTPSGKKTYVFNAIIANDVSLEKENTNPYFWILIKHPLPIVPNLRLEYTNVSTKGLANGTFENFIAKDASTQFDMTQYDFIPYYNLIDNTLWITLDLGLNIKLVEVEHAADNVSVNKNPNSSIYTNSKTVFLPLIYTRIRMQLPITNIGFEADAKFLSYSSSSVYDIRAKIDYTFDFTPVFQPAIEFGYRVQKYDIDEDDLEGKLFLEFSGFYAGIMLRF